MPGPRHGQKSDRIKQIVAGLLERRIKDPRLGFVTITDVRLTGDGQHASVFYTVLGDEAARRDSAAALSSATGLIRSEVGKLLGVRHTPSIEFHIDSVPEVAKELEDLLAQVKTSDAQIAARAEGATYAGGENPYKEPRAEGASDSDD
ncbi:MAG: 30S ribosome-binding factor RbfA [Actinomycetales bacterium]|nr:30S ribosome-binding factor RbfA [Actinomycetales bacterium]